jgi:chitinase
MPDPQYLTHVNYGFGHVNATFDGIRVEDPVRLRQISLMKIKYPKLKILLSIGGWEGSNGYSQMGMSDELREKFAADCQRVVKAYKLDGIDIDWEYPTIAGPRNTASPYDTENFTKLIRAVRAAIGTSKLLSSTSLASATVINFHDVIQYLDYVNVMTYDMGIPPYHHASLYRSAISGTSTVDESIQTHLQSGVPTDKLNLGISFYGEGARRIPHYVLLDRVVQLEGYNIKWDPIGKTPYLADAVTGNLVFSYENPASVVAKTKYAIEYNLRGIMIWEYAGDTHDKHLIQSIDRVWKDREKEKKLVER